MSFHYEKDANQIVTVTMDMDGPVNSMSDAFLPLFESTLDSSRPRQTLLALC